MELKPLLPPDKFPRATSDNCEKSSDATPTYNCIAYAAGDTTKWWWPVPIGGCYWPDDVPSDLTLSSFIALFAREGYETCADDSFEEGFEKVAIYTDMFGRPTHAARQEDDGRWTSKIGRDIDIKHRTVEDIGSGLYGRAVHFMKRAYVARVPNRPQPRRKEPRNKRHKGARKR